MIVEEITRADRADWARLYRAYGEFYQRPVSQGTLDQIWAWLFDAEMDFHGLVVRNGDQLAGLLHYRGMPSPLRGQMIGFADDLFVDPRYRGQGVARELAGALRERARARGWPIVRWITAENNHQAMALYDQIARKTSWQTYELDCAAAG